MDNVPLHACAAGPVRLHGPDELLQAIPYLLGFHPAQSLVVVGLTRGYVSVTMRADLDADSTHGLAGQLVDALCRARVSAAFAVVYSEQWPPGQTRPYADVVVGLGLLADDVGIELVDGYFVSGRRRWSYRCHDDECCPAAGVPVESTPGVFAAEATVAGMVALPSRADLVALLDPEPDRGRLDDAIAAHENAAMQAVLEGRVPPRIRSLKRAIFAAARASATATVRAPDDDVARFGVALTETQIRDAVWLAVDDRRIAGFELWRDLARRLPVPYDAPALFLLGWTAWRDGNGAIASIAAQRAVDSDPTYSAADLLLAAISRGVDPRRVPRLRTRSA